MAEDRQHFAAMLDKLRLKQTQGGTATNEHEAIAVAKQIGYPVLVRPSFVLGGRAMEIVHEEKDLRRYIRTAVEASPERPILVDRFLEDATEVDVDCIADGERCVIGGVMEHIEQAGIHSGDSACVIPTFSLSSRSSRGHQARHHRDGPRTPGARADECSVRRQGGGSLCARSKSPRLTHCPLREQGDR